MKIVAPNYYKKFNCIADKCKHTCCKGWEIEIDDESMNRYADITDINAKIERGEDNHFRLLEDEACPFLLKNGLCEMILKYGEDMLCQTCTDHPRYRNYWADRIEIGLGMVCEEAARIILSEKDPISLEIISFDDAEEDELTEDEKWLLEYRDNMLSEVKETGPIARLKEYLIYRHIADALYDDRLEERVSFIDRFVQTVQNEWDKTEGDLEALIEIVRQYSYDVEYDEDEKEKWLN